VTHPGPRGRETEQILSYYRSGDAGRLYSPPTAESKVLFHPGPVSTRSSSPSSDYTSDCPSDPSNGHKLDLDSLPPPPARLRPKGSFTHAMDTRRFAVVHLESSGNPRTATPEYDSSATVTHPLGLRARRGFGTPLGDLAPPDVLPDALAFLAPPSTAPAFSSQAGFGGDAQVAPLAKHQRSASDLGRAAKSRKHGRTLSRDVGIVGTTLEQEPLATGQPSPPYPSSQPSSPIFQVPRTRSPSPEAPSSEVSDHPTRHQRSPATSSPRKRSSFVEQQPIVNPSGIGQETRTYEPIAPPIVVPLLADPSNSKARSTLENGPSSGINSLLSSPASSSAMQVSMATPAPVPFSPNFPSSYLYYQPGVHATAGPLPPPPRALFNIDPLSPPPPRPPRLHSPNPRLSNSSPSRGKTEAVNQALLVPGSTVTSTMTLTPSGDSSPPLIPPKPEEKGPECACPFCLTILRNPNHPERPQPHPNKSIHLREGAFSPSGSSSAESIEPRLQDGLAKITVRPNTHTTEHDTPISISVDPPPPPTKEAERQRPTYQLRDDDDVILVPKRDPSPAVSVSPRLSLHSSSARSLSPPKTQHSNGNSPGGLKSTLLKRFSTLPRTPTSPSTSDKRLSNSGSSRSARTPSPASAASPTTPSSPKPSLPVKKIINQAPAALWSSEVFSMHSPMERSMLYAEKINELYIHDCGLGVWLAQTTFKSGPNAARVVKRPPRQPPAERPAPPPSSVGIRPRRLSRASMMSEATFPIREDACTATDLSARPQDDLSPLTPPALPYPSLVQAPLLTRSTSGHVTQPVSLRANSALVPPAKSGGFFFSLGRKASLKRSNGATITNGGTSTANRVLTKSPPPQPPNPRPIQIAGSPSVPGGPRAVPSRVQRSQTIMVSPSSFRNSMVARRPSLNVAASPTSPSSTRSPRMSAAFEADPEFIRQVDKLQDLLPHAERKVLMAYLRRAGQDILAIGQYLEDERNGTIQRD
jgi:hypothetical protein